MKRLRRFVTAVILAITLTGAGSATSAFSMPNFHALASTRPVNGKIAYVDNWQIYVANSDGTQKQCITCARNIFQATAPSLSPNGKYIAFKALYQEPPSEGIAVMDINGGNLRNLGEYDSGKSDIGEDLPTWSPDGTKIAYATYRDKQWGIFINNAAGSNEQRLSYNDEAISSPAWSPDGKRLAFASYHGLIILSPGLSADKTQIYAAGEQVDSVAWAPDGTRMAFTSQNGLFTIDSDGTVLHHLVDYYEALVAWSHDGKTIAFISIPDSYCGCMTVALINPDGSNQRELYRGNGIVANPAWSPDDLQILFMVNADTVNDSWYGSDIYVIGADGTGMARLATGWDPTWLLP